jgi:abnormal spindle-like microcephaly-associated protein
VEIARSLSRICLSGESDIARHLKAITRSQLEYEQYPLDHYSYRITNLSVDLRDGVRLAKTISALGGKNLFTQNFRFPAIGPSHRVHNLRIILGGLKEGGVNLTSATGEALTPQDIETGNREKTLFLVWRIISHWVLPRYLSKICLQEEVIFLHRILEVRGERAPDIKVRTGVYSLFDLIVFLFLQFTNDDCTPVADALVEWARLVCFLYGRPLQGFAASFTTYEPFYSIIHYYFPRQGIRFFESQMSLPYASQLISKLDHLTLTNI